MSSIALFLVKACSRRQVNYIFKTDSFTHNINVFSGDANETMPHSDTLAYSMEKISPDGLQKLLRKMVNRIIRMKAVQSHRLLGRYYLIAIDGTGNLTFSHKHCDKCLWKEKDGKILYWYHPIVEAKLVTGTGLAFSIGTEFIENTGGSVSKQDCETNATKRLLERLKRDFPQLEICLLLDALYANGPMIELVHQYNWKCIITFKEGCMPDVWKSAQGLKKLQRNNCGSFLYKGKLQQCRWVNGVSHYGRDMSVIECIEQKPDGTETYFVWLTNIVIDKSNYAAIAKGGRSRWKIENEGFNMQKQGGYNLEHPYSKHAVGMRNFYLIMQIAHFINQLIEKGSLLTSKIRSAFGSIKNIAFQLLEDLRTRKIDPHFFTVPAASFQIRLDTSWKIYSLVPGVSPDNPA